MDDYILPSPFEVTFPCFNFTNIACVIVQLVDDDGAEGDHDFTVSIESTSPEVTIGMPVPVTIGDDDGMYVLERNINF